MDREKECKIPLGTISKQALLENLPSNRAFFCKQLRLCTRFPWEGLTDRVGDLTGTPQGHGVAHSLGLSTGQMGDLEQ